MNYSGVEFHQSSGVGPYSEIIGYDKTQSCPPFSIPQPSHWEDPGFKKRLRPPPF